MAGRAGRGDIWVGALLAGAVALSGCATMGTGKVPVTGKVLDAKSSEPLRAVVVTVRMQDPKDDYESECACEEVSNSRGEFNCTGLQDGDFKTVKFRNETRYVLECTLTGFKTASTTFTYQGSLKPYEVKLASAVSDGSSEVTSENPPELAVGGAETQTIK